MEKIKLLGFNEWFELNEQSQAKKGDWKKGQGWFIQVTGKLNMSKAKFIDNIYIPKLDKELELYKYEDETYSLGYWSIEEIDTKIGKEQKDVFVKVWIIELNPTDIGINGYSNVMNVDGVVVNMAKKYENSGISTIMYKYLVNTLNYTVLGDSEQYFGARKLWKRLSLSTDVNVDIVNIKTKEILFKNIILHQGDNWNDFDKRLWSYSKDKHYIRSILTYIS